MHRPSTALTAALSLLLAFALGGCGTTGAGRGAPGRTTGAAAVQPPSLSTEQKRLAELFRGTPVVFEMVNEKTMRVEVPLKFSFDPGRAAVKAPLAAVLDRVATSQKGAGTRFTIVAPPDRPSAPLVGADRAASTRDYLVARGIAVSRFNGVERGAGDEVEIRIVQQ